MGLRCLSGLCLAVFSVSALAAGPVSVDVAAGTTTYSVNSRTIKVPPVASLSAARDITPVVTRVDSGLSQTARGRLIVAVPETNKTLSVDIKGRINVSSAGLKNSVKAFSRTLPYLGLGLTAVEGIDYLISNHSDWFFDDEGYLVKPAADSIAGLSGVDFNTYYPEGFPSSPGFSPYRQYTLLWASRSHNYGGSEDVYNSVMVGSSYANADCRLMNGSYTHDSCILLAKIDRNNFYRYLLIPPSFAGAAYEGYVPYYLRILSIKGDLEGSLVGGGEVGKAYFGTVQPEGDDTPEYVSQSEFDDLVESKYMPFVSDWEPLFSHFDSLSEPASFTVDEPIGGYQPDSVITTTPSPEGDVVTQQDEAFTLSVRNNSTGQPEIDITYNSSLDSYMNGQKIDSSSSTSVYQASLPDSDVTVHPDVGGGGVGSGLFDFCSFAPILCDWIDWTQEPLDDDLDLSQLITDEDFEHSYNISFGDSSCPEPISLNVAFLNKNIDLSYEPACELAGYANPLVLISAYLFAIYIGLGVVRNG